MRRIPNRHGTKIASLVAAAGAVTAGLLLGGSASGAPIADVTPPRAFLLELDEASTTRAFRQARPDGVPRARAAARARRAEIGEAQADVIEDLPADARVIYRTHSVLAGIGVRARADEKEALERIPGVGAVFPIAPKRVENSYAVPFQGAPAAWQSTGFLGQGQKIAVIDTGVDYTHAGFGGPGTRSAYQEAHAAEAQTADPDLFPSQKVVGGTDLVGDGYNADRNDPNYQPIPHPDPNPLDCNGHGSHVAGSAAGYGVNADGSTYTGGYDQSTDFDAMRIGPGMAPEASVYAIKVFGCEGSSDVIAEAIDRATDPNGDGDPSDGVDVINLSVGSDFGSDQDGDSVAANAAAALGVSVVASAGNAGDLTDISGSPGDASRVVSVASGVDAQSWLDGADVTIDGDPHSFGVSRSYLYDWDGEGDLSGPVVAAPEGNPTACDAYPPHAFDGKVVLVEWHDAAPECGSVVRGGHLADAGAIGFIFGSDSETFTADINGSDQIPGVLMVASGADAIRQALEDSHDVVVTGTQVSSVKVERPQDNDEVSGFSSRGIHATGNVKPDVTAVGSSVFSNAVGTGDRGVSFSGTSMAAPMVAGLAALVRQANPGWTPLQVKADVMNTAGNDLYVDGSADPSSGRYGPVRAGAGRIDAASAVANDVLAFNPGNGSVSVSFGPVEAAGPVTLTREVTVESHAAESRELDLSYEPVNEVPGAEFEVAPASISLAPGQSRTVTVTLRIDDPADLTKAVDPTVGRTSEEDYPRETLAEAMGRLLVVPDSGEALRVPVYAAPRPASDMSQAGTLPMPRGGSEQAAEIALTGSGVGSRTGDNGIGVGGTDDDIQSVVAGFELQATSGEAPRCDQQRTVGCWRLPEERDADLSMVGYTSDFPQTGDAAASLGYFALAVRAPWTIPSDKVFLQVDIDVDRDGTPDLFLFNSRLEGQDVFVSALVDPSKPKDDRVIDVQLVNGRFGDLDTALYDSDVMVLPVALDVLGGYGIDPDNPRIDYGVEAYTAFSEQPIDLIGVDPDTETLSDPLSADLFRPGIAVTNPGGDGPLLRDQPGLTLKVTRNVDSYEADDGRGVMMVHFHNPVGEKAQRVEITKLGSRTTATVTPDSVVAEVAASTAGGPAPGGSVTFSVDGQRVGSADLASGRATLAFRVPNGARRQVEATYSGDADYAPSSGRVDRLDPSISARISSPRRKGSRGWYRAAVTVRFTCVTHGSELAGGCPVARVIRRDGRRIRVTGVASAKDGGRASVTTGALKIDRHAPRVRIRGIRRGKAYRRAPRARCVARDATSGVLRCRIRKARRGQRLVYTAKAVDRAGNVRRARVPVRLRRG